MDGSRRDIMGNKRKKITKSPSPPRFAGFIFRLLLKDDAYRERTGDLEEIYVSIAKERGAQHAAFWMLWEVIKSVPTFIKESTQWRCIMLKNYLLITFRNMKRHKAYSFVTISGLAVGMASFILIMLFVRWELSYDTFHEKGDLIYRVIVKSESGTYNLGKTTMGVIPSPMAATMTAEFPELARITRVHRARNCLFIHEDKKFEHNGLYVDPHFLKIFTFPLTKGNIETALQDPLTIVITEAMGKKFFGNDDPIGKTLNFPYTDKYYDLKVTGILKEVPKNSHLQFDCLISLSSWKNLRGETEYVGRWENWNAFIYVELNPGHNPLEFAKKLPPHLEKHTGRKQSISFLLQPIKSIHLKSDAFIEISENNKMSTIYILSCIALIILLIACFNTINLVTARASRRSREIGIRKVVGARREQLIRQFLSESIALSLIAFMFSLIIVLTVLPTFCSFIDNKMEVQLFDHPASIVRGLCLVFVVGILAGTVPALLMSSFRPVNALRGGFLSIPGKYKARNILVMIQFSISITLIASTLIIVRQMNYIRSKNMGYEREQILVVDIRDSQLRKHQAVIKNTILKNPCIFNAAYSWALPSDIVPRMGATVEAGTFPENNDRFISYYTVVDQDYLNVYGIELLSGRNFSDSFALESQEAVIINETAARQLGWENPLGKKYQCWAAENGRIIGVVKDFHFHSLHQKIEPLALGFKPNDGRFLSLKISPLKLKETVGYIKKTIESYHPNYPFTYFFFNDAFNDMYISEKKLGTLFGIFSVLAVLIACLGLLGLASFSIESRTKEVGIRKVLGASLPGIFVLLTKEFVKWVVLANIIAWPVAFYAMKKWQNHFAYQTDIRLFIFFLSGLMAAVIAVLTVSLQSIKAAKANPVDSLQYE